MQQPLESRNGVLRQQGYRLTQPREVIVRVLQEAQGHLNIEQILQRVHRYLPRVHLVTIYRTLGLLKELDLVQERHFSGEQVQYEVREGKEHHHLVCRECGAVSHLEQVLPCQFHEQVGAQYHFHEVTLELVATGYCDKCWKSSQSK